MTRSSVNVLRTADTRAVSGSDRRGYQDNPISNSNCVADRVVGERVKSGVDPDQLSDKDSISGPVVGGLSITTNAKRASPSLVPARTTHANPQARRGHNLYNFLQIQIGILGDLFTLITNKHSHNKNPRE